MIFLSFFGHVRLNTALLALVWLKHDNLITLTEENS